MEDKTPTRRRKTKNVLRRAGWMFMALLFLVTALGVGIYGFWQATHQKDSANNAQTADSSQQNKVKGKQMDNFTPIPKIENLQTIDTKIGTGAEAKTESTVTVDYTGAVASTGVIFESSKDSGQPATFGLDQVITGWKEGIPGMKAGGIRRLLIPAAKAYGANPPPGSGIPANADLVFDVTLLSVK